MSRYPANSRLLPLFRRAERKYDEPFTMLDLRSICQCSRTALHRYTTGRKAYPRIEAAMAAYFGLSVAALRKQLFNGPLRPRAAARRGRDGMLARLVEDRRQLRGALAHIACNIDGGNMDAAEASRYAQSRLAGRGKK